MTKVNKAEAVERIAQLRRDGKTIRQICAEVGLSKTHVARFIKIFGMQGAGVPHCPHCGVALPPLNR